MSHFDVVIPILQGINAGVSGIASAPTIDDRYPNKLVTAGSPWALTFAGSGQSNTVSPNLQQDNREYVTEVYFQPAMNAGDIQKTRVECGRILGEMVNSWTALGNDESWVLDYGDISGYRVLFNYTAGVRDTGVSVEMVYDDERQKWWGFQFFIPIVVQWGSAVC